MARRRKRPQKIDTGEMDMTPMIDIVFQLIIFFVLSSKFIALEGQLLAYLPKDRGLQSSVSEIEPVEVSFFFDWLDDTADGRVVCQTMNYQPPDGSARVDAYEFGTEDGRQSIKYGPKRESVVYGYHVPNFDEVEQYLKYRHETFRGASTGLPVTINVTDRVPTQMVVNILDACARIGISNVTIAAKEVEY